MSICNAARAAARSRRGRGGLRRLLAALIAAGAMQQGGATAQAVDPGLAGAPVFTLPGVVAAWTQARRLYSDGDPQAGAAAMRALTRRAPGAGDLQVDLAIMALALGRRDEAVAAMRAAAALDAPMLAGALAGPLADLRAEAAPTPTPTPTPAPAPAPPPIDARDGVAAVTEDVVGWSRALGLLSARVRFAPTPPARTPVVAADDARRAARTVARLHARGAAAGNHGDLYDNRDDGHSALKPALAPQMAVTRYGPMARQAQAHYGLNAHILFDAIVLGNSSTAITTGALARSQARMALTRPAALRALTLQYAANHLYVYPEHRDHDPDRGDLFPANTPYMLIAQGSSGADQPILEALTLTLAALPPRTKAFLRERGLIAPTLQALARRTLADACADGDATAPCAHPTAIEPTALDPERLVAAASALTPATAPAVARLTVTDRDALRPNIDILGDARDEVLFDTPSAAARLFRGLPRTRRYTLDASDSVDPNGHALRFRWRVLRGAARITPRSPDGATIDVEIDWQDPGATPGRPDLAVGRVDVAVIADNGHGASAPAFFSVAFPPRERREYGANGALLWVDYDDPALAHRVADPLLFPHIPWRDTFDRGPDGALLGWERVRHDGAPPERYDAQGLRITAQDAAGRALRVEPVRYLVRPTGDGRRQLRAARVGSPAGRR